MVDDHSSFMLCFLENSVKTNQTQHSAESNATGRQDEQLTKGFVPLFCGDITGRIGSQH